MNKIKELRMIKGITQTKFATYLNTTQANLSGWESDKWQPDQATLIKIADYFNVSVDYLLGRTERLPANAITSLGSLIKMQVIGSIAAGYCGLAEEDIIDEIEIPEFYLHGYHKEDCFILKVKGDSMYPDYQNKDLVLVHKQSSVDSGSVAVVLYNGDEATLKKVEYKKGENWVKLIPRNPEFAPKLIENEALEECNVLGEVIALIYRSSK